jgi:predicted RNA methylase
MKEAAPQCDFVCMISLVLNKGFSAGHAVSDGGAGTGAMAATIRFYKLLNESTG